MDTKLTLRLESEVIEKAKVYAKQNKTSLSKMIENYLRSLTDTTDEPVKVTPLVKSLTGVIKLDENDYKRDYTNFLSEKYR
jgi:hypothetical protein